MRKRKVTKKKKQSQKNKNIIRRGKRKISKPTQLEKGKAAKTEQTKQQNVFSKQKFENKSKNNSQKL